MSVPLPAVTESLKGETLSTRTHVDGFGEAFLFTPSLPPSIHPSQIFIFNMFRYFTFKSIFNSLNLLHFVKSAKSTDFTT